MEQLIQRDCYSIHFGDLNVNIQVDWCGHKQLLDVASFIIWL
jgi:hypothetical protein